MTTSKSIKCTRWTEEEKSALAKLLSAGLKKKIKIHAGVSIAGRKLNRSPQACEWQWHNNIKKNLDFYLNYESNVEPKAKDTEVVEEPTPGISIKQMLEATIPNEETKPEPTVSKQPRIKILDRHGDDKEVEIVAHVGNVILGRFLGHFIQITL